MDKSKTEKSPQRQRVALTALPDERDDEFCERTCYFIKYAKQKPTLLRENILILLDIPNLFKLSMLNK